jgi:hypothetical protein
MPAGYLMSSGRNARLAAAGRQRRGERSPTVTASHAAGIGPVGPLDGDLQGDHWCGHSWSDWPSLADLLREAPGATGLYRLRSARHDALAYVGEGGLAKRLRGHRRAAASGTGPHGTVFLAASPLDCSYVCNEGWLAHQRQELENDLIAAHMLALQRPPFAQFSS